MGGSVLLERIKLFKTVGKVVVARKSLKSVKTLIILNF